jgi:hypothetical protein
MKVTCIPLQCSVDDATFMDTTNVGSSFSHAHMNQETALQDMVDNWNGSNDWHRPAYGDLLDKDEGVLRCKKKQPEMSAPHVLCRPVGRSSTPIVKRGWACKPMLMRLTQVAQMTPIG